MTRILQSAWSGRLLAGFFGAVLLAVSALAPTSAQGQQTDKQRAEEIKKLNAELDKIRARLKELEAADKAAAKPAPDKPATTPWVGSIKVEGKLSKTERAELAKVSKADAEKAALAAVSNPDAKIADSGLKVTNGFLVWTVDVEIKSAPDVEVIVDAGNGRVLSPAPHPGAAPVVAPKAATPVKEAPKPPMVIEVDLSKLPPDLLKEVLKYSTKPK